MKLIVLDVDGVLSQGEAHAFDLTLLKRLAELNHLARHDSQIPAVTLNTGRPSPYVEAIMQTINGWQPAAFESGGGVYFPQQYQFQTTPLLTSQQMITFHNLINEIDQRLVKTGQAYWQPGKTVCFSLFACAPRTMADVINDVREIIGDLSDQFVVTPAVHAINIHPAHINKGSGLEGLAEVTGIDPADMGGIGDSAADIDFLRLVGHAAAPANATSETKAVVKYVSPKATADGVHDILNHWGI
jgi:hydroxymethylpyrimidine pyrophosphatase-like HAD family hydrolase